MAQRKKSTRRFNVEEALTFCIDLDNEDLGTLFDEEEDEKENDVEDENIEY